MMIVAALMPGIMLVAITLGSGFAWYFFAGNGGVLCTPAIILALVTVMMAAATYMLPAFLLKRSRIGQTAPARLGMRTPACVRHACFHCQNLAAPLR